jgi:hypothetical protein
LKEEAGTDRTAFRRALEKSHPMTLALEQNCSGRTRRSAADDGNPQPILHAADASPHARPGKLVLKARPAFWTRDRKIQKIQHLLNIGRIGWSTHMKTTRCVGFHVRVNSTNSRIPCPWVWTLKG